jgi:hypothetical protein
MGKYMRRSALLAALLVAVWAGAAAAATSQFDTLVSQARLALDTGRAEESMTIFEHAASVDARRAEEIAPDRAWAFIRVGNDAVAAGDWRRANECFTAASAMYPDFGDIIRAPWTWARLRLADIAVEEATQNPKRADWPALADDMRWLLDNGEDSNQAHYLLGIVYEFQRKEDLAREQYLVAAGDEVGPNQSMDALRDDAYRASASVSRVFPLRSVYPLWKKADPGKWQELHSGPFIIYHHNRALAERVAAALVYYLNRPLLNGLLPASGPFPDVCKVYIFPDEQTFRAQGKTEQWASATSKFTFVDGKLETTSIQYLQTARDLTENALPHELAHVRLVASAHFYEALPLWLQEGVAQSAESDFSKVIKARDLVTAKDADKLIPVVDLMAAKSYPEGEASDAYYAESLAIVDVLAKEYGKEAFWKFVAELKDKDQTEALRDAFNLAPVNLEDLVLGWIDAHKDWRTASHTRTGIAARPRGRTAARTLSRR